MIYGIKGIMLGTLISLIVIVVLWKPYFLYKFGFKKTVFEYWRKLLRYVLSLVITLIILSQLSDLLYLDSKVDNYLDWLVLALKISCITLIIYIPMLFINEGFKDLFNRFNTLIKQRFFKK